MLRAADPSNARAWASALRRLSRRAREVAEGDLDKLSVAAAAASKDAGGSEKKRVDDDDADRPPSDARWTLSRGFSGHWWKTAAMWSPPDREDSTRCNLCDAPLSGGGGGGPDGGAATSWTAARAVRCGACLCSFCSKCCAHKVCRTVSRARGGSDTRRRSTLLSPRASPTLKRPRVRLTTRRRVVRLADLEVMRQPVCSRCFVHAVEPAASSSEDEEFDSDDDEDDDEARALDDQLLLTRGARVHVLCVAADGAPPLPPTLKSSKSAAAVIARADDAGADGEGDGARVSLTTPVMSTARAWLLATVRKARADGTFDVEFDEAFKHGMHEGAYSSLGGSIVI